MVIPKQIQAGDTLTIEFTADYDSATFIPNVVLTNASKTYTKAGSGEFEIVLTAAETALYTPGNYAYSVFVSDGTDRYTIESGFVDVKADLTAGITDARTSNRKILEAIEASIQGAATLGQLQTTINGRSIQRYTPEQLIKLHSHFKRLCKEEDSVSKFGTGNRKIFVRF